MINLHSFLHSFFDSLI